MGCGSQRTNNSVVQSKHKNDIRRGSKTTNFVGKTTLLPTAIEMNQDNPSNKEDNGMDCIDVNPSQFVLQNDESIYLNYSLKEKLGEGNYCYEY